MNMQNYNHSAYRLSELPEKFCDEKFPIGNGIITVHSFTPFNEHPSLFDMIKNKLGFVKRRYRVTLWFEDKIASFADVEIKDWKKNYDLKRNVINDLFKATEKEV